ncbi:MAG: flagellar motor protein MotB [Proteobacteria bacterium]|nr:MAG: flagellar motor protein MotB [Pseudomonadota bacterium]
MTGKITVLSILALAGSAGVWAQPTPIYQVTVIERTVKAVDYQYKNGPTKIDFRGTVLLPHAKGEAIVESKSGRTEIAAKFERVEAASRFGAEYLTYVLWAITPEGHTKNLGEVLADASNHAHLSVTTDLQSFGLIVTAEPYAAVRQPSDVVVMENEIRPDTIGHIEPVQAKAELLPRGHYTYTKDARPPAGGEKLSMDRYESLLEVYQAQNAVQIAKAAGADKYAPDTYARAEQLLRQAQEFQAKKADRSTTVTAARQAAQTAEDARTITVQKKHGEELAQARAEVTREQQLRIQAEARAAADRAQLEAERASRRQGGEVETVSVPVQQPVAGTPPPLTEPLPPVAPPAQPEQAKTELRVQMLQELLEALPSRDTPRGLVVTLGNGNFRGTVVTPEYFGRLSRVASIVAAHPGLSVTVEGSSEGAGDAKEASDRAAAVREELVRSGVPASAISVRGLGNSRPIGPAGPENRRVEITISGEPIGTVAYWDKSYTIAPRQ